MSSIHSPPEPSPPTTTTTTPHPSSPPSSSNPDPEPKQTHEAKAAFTATLHSVGSNHEAALRDRARTLHANSAALSKQEADLATATEGLRRQNDGWAKVADSARDGLKEIGDVQNWAELIERDLMVVEEAVRLAEEREERERGGEREDIGNGNGSAEGDEDANGKGKGTDGGKKKGWLWW